MFSRSLYHLLPLLAVIPTVKTQIFFKAGGSCTPLCENVYREAREFFFKLPSGTH
jgi:hypothetical protein